MKRLVAILTMLAVLSSFSICFAKSPVLAFEELEYNLIPKKSITLKPISQNIEEKLSYEWESSDPDIATVKQGKVTAVSVGTADIICTGSAKTGESYTAKCTIHVLQPIEKITVSQKKVELPFLATYSPDVTIEPENASLKELDWTSSKPEIVSVNENGEIWVRGTGKVTITGKSKDGSKKTVEYTVISPKVYVTDKSVTITEPEGVEFGYQWGIGGFLSSGIKDNGVVDTESIDDESSDFGGFVTLDKVRLIPLKAGKTSYVFKANGSRVLTVEITVEHSAVYDKVSCPPTTVEKVLTNGEKILNQKMSFTGEIVSTATENDVNLFYLKDETGYLVFTSEATNKITTGQSYTIYGTLKDFTEYKTQTGLQYECPVIEVKKVESN